MEPSQLRREIDFEGRVSEAQWTEPEPNPDWGRLDRQENQLEKWARENGFLVDAETERLWTRAADGEPRQGNEHAALLYSADGWVIRKTIGNKLGLPGKTPSQYLKRWEDSARFSPQTAAMFLGFSRDAQGNGVIWTAQRFESAREPTPDELVDKMNDLGFETIDGLVFYRDDGIKISDANPDNVKVDDEGNLRFIDVWIEFRAEAGSTGHVVED